MRASRARRNKCSNSYQLDFTARELSQIETVLRHIRPTPCASAPAVIHSRVFARTAFSRVRGVTKRPNASDVTTHVPPCGTSSGLTFGEGYGGTGVGRPHRLPHRAFRPTPRYAGTRDRIRRALPGLRQAPLRDCHRTRRGRGLNGGLSHHPRLRADPGRASVGGPTAGAGRPTAVDRPGAAGSGASVSAGPRRCAPPAGPAIR